MKKFITKRLAFIVAPLFLLLVVIMAVVGGTSNNQCESGNNVGTVLSSADKKKTAQSIANSLKDIPNVKPAGISAYLGNADVESGLNSKAVQSGAVYDEAKAMNPGLSGYAIGFNQWDGSRRVDLINYAKSQGKSWDDPTLQLDFALHHDGANSEILKKGLAMDDVAEATEYLRSKWERGGVGTTEKRTSLAKQFYLDLSNGNNDPPALSVSSDNAKDSNNQDNQDAQEAGCSTNASQGMGSSGAPVTSIPEQYKDKISDTNFTATSPTNTYPVNQCTWYAFNRMQELGTPVENALGNGADWGNNAKARGYNTDSQPHVGWVVSFSQGAAGADPTYGHVAVVEAMSDDGSHFLVSECNVVNSGSGTISFRELTAGAGMTFIEGRK